MTGPRCENVARSRQPEVHLGRAVAQSGGAIESSIAAICWWTRLTACSGRIITRNSMMRSLVIATNDVDAVDVFSLHGGLELQDGRVSTNHAFWCSEIAYRSRVPFGLGREVLSQVNV